ncbi:hypothetical protein [Actinomadura verrucosospora]|uniref:Uncharacterized protein n=1 Tax=Actinomadura verrucosospora TaxID=46165 RepID=A0A7D3ZR98_ACTVE|nr:hypothetical protein [Actinomadura verrucosospora]QKG25543.1 hypothetical protein ACTIVE_7195 [Actinomadura verrucosospora]
MTDGLIPGGGGGYLLYNGALGRLAQRLHTTGTKLDGQAATAPGAPDAGVCAAAVASVLELFAESLGGIVDAFSVSADTVVHNQGVYAKAEQTITYVNTPGGCKIVRGIL